MQKIRYQGYTLEVTDEETCFQGTPLKHLVRQVCTSGGYMRPASFKATLPQSRDAEEESIPQQPIDRASLTFERNRAKVIAELRAIVRGIMEHYELPKRNGIDIGSGATGAMVHDLLPEESAATWKEIEINPNAVKENRKRHSKASVVQGSYFNLKQHVEPGSTNIITGLSCLDNTSFLPDALTSIEQTLRPGGILLHIQDVRPGNGVTERWRQRNKYPSPSIVDWVNDGSIYGAYTPNGRYVSATDMLREELEQKIKARRDMSLVLNQWVTARRPSRPPDLGVFYHQNVALSGSPVTPLPETIATAVVTIARKK